MFFAGDDGSEKFKSAEPSRRENVLVMRLANKEQEVQEYVVGSSNGFRVFVLFTDGFVFEVVLHLRPHLVARTNHNDWLLYGMSLIAKYRIHVATQLLYLD